MEIILKWQQNYLIRLDRREELIEELKKFCQKEKIKSAFFWGLGAASEGEIAFYDLKKRDYQKEKFKKGVEILNLIGNVATLNKEIIVHAHGLFGDSKMQVFGGHINYLVIGATGEIFLKKFQKGIKRKYSKEIGLNLLN